MSRWMEAARGAGSGDGATARQPQEKLHLPVRPAPGRVEYPASGRRGAGEVLLRDRRWRPSTRRDGWLERLRSRGDCQPWDILAEESGRVRAHGLNADG